MWVGIVDLGCSTGAVWEEGGRERRGGEEGHKKEVNEVVS